MIVSERKTELEQYLGRDLDALRLCLRRTINKFRITPMPSYYADGDMITELEKLLRKEVTK